MSRLVNSCVMAAFLAFLLAGCMRPAGPVEMPDRRTLVYERDYTVYVKACYQTTMRLMLRSNSIPPTMDAFWEYARWAGEFCVEQADQAFGEQSKAISNFH